MSLFKKVKAKLSQKIQTSKEERQRKQLNQASLKKEKEEAQWAGYRKGALARAQTEGYRQGKGQQGTGKLGKAGNILGKFASGSQSGLDFLNQDMFGTGYGTTSKPQAQGKKSKAKKKKPKTTSIFDLF